MYNWFGKIRRKNSYSFGLMGVFFKKKGLFKKIFLKSGIAYSFRTNCTQSEVSCLIFIPKKNRMMKKNIILFMYVVNLGFDLSQKRIIFL